ncbi:unnamed protein product [marine sediment metagenome]|uniref:Uncharacterized protein n=1 Tax=marine sediment metagenome TaxID=412755 RepID=X0YXL7_9ZZZZ
MNYEDMLYQSGTLLEYKIDKTGYKWDIEKKTLLTRSYQVLYRWNCGIGLNIHFYIIDSHLGLGCLLYDSNF